MASTPTRSSALALGVLLAAGAAGAHPQGFHKRLTVTVSPTRISALVVMDVDSGERCLLLREPFDADRDGLLEGDEVRQLKERLVRLATRPLRLSLSSAPLPLAVRDAKVSLRDDRRANDAGLSVAVLLELELSSPPGPGMTLELEDVSPDQSELALQVFQAGAVGPPFQAEVKSGVKTRVRIQ